MMSSGWVSPKGTKKPRLVDMKVVLIDHGDRCFAEAIGLSQAVGGQCPTGSPAQDDDAMHLRTPILSISA